MKFKIVNLNFWMGKRLRDSLAFLEKEVDDHSIVTLQEVEEQNVPQLERVLGTPAVCGPMHLRRKRNPPANRLSVMLFSKLQMEDPLNVYYGTFNKHKRADWWRSGSYLACVLTGATFRSNGSSLRVATTHFTWAGRPTEDAEQNLCLPSLRRALSMNRVQVFTCDLNSPRYMQDGSKGEVWHAVTTDLRDNIPHHVQTTLDPIHPATKDGLSLIVDGLFSSPCVSVNDVVVHQHVSDHCGITALVHTRPSKE